MRKHKRNLTREERLLRNEKIAYLILVALWGAILAAALVSFIMEKVSATTEEEVWATMEIDEPPTPAEEAQAVPVEPETTIVLEVPKAVAFNPVREDIPLDAETQRLLYQSCTGAGVPYELALAVIRQETNFRNIIGDGGDSIGYMQVQPRWHRERMERLSVFDLSDPEGNFLVGCDYLAEMLGQGRGIEWALHAYNGGASYANKMARAGQVSQYASSILNYMNDLNMEEENYGSLDF